jgi:hypothetical protein
LTVIDQVAAPEYMLPNVSGVEVIPLTTGDSNKDAGISHFLVHSLSASAGNANSAVMIKIIDFLIPIPFGFAHREIGGRGVRKS